MKKLLILIVCFIFFINLSYAQDSAEYKDCLDKRGELACTSFYGNPTAESLTLLSNPTEEEFQYLLHENPEEAARYLHFHYDSSFAEQYLASIDMSEITPEGKFVAVRYYGEEISHINGNKIQFSQFMYHAYDVTLNMEGNLQGYSAQGVLQGANGQINVRDFASDYSFIVNEKGEILLKPKSLDREYSFKGTITKDKDGRFHMFEGEFNGVEVKEIQNLQINKKGDIVVEAHSFGDFTFQETGSMVYDPDMEQYTFDNAILEGHSQYILTGTVGVNKGLIFDDYYVPAGSSLVIKPSGVETNEGYIIKASGGQAVAVDLSNDDWTGIFHDFIVQWTEGEQDENAVYFDRQTHVALAEATVAQEGYESSYELGVSPGLDLYPEAEETAGEFITYPSRGYYQKGDYPAKGTKEYAAIQQIQRIIGVEDDGQYGPATKAAVIQFQNQYNERMGYSYGDAGYIKSDGAWGQLTSVAYLDLVNKEDITRDAGEEFDSTVTFLLGTQYSGGAAVIGFGQRGLHADLAGDVLMDYRDKYSLFHDANFGIQQYLQGTIGGEIEIPMVITSTTTDSQESTFLTGEYALAAGDGSLGIHMDAQTPLLYGEKFGTLDLENANCAAYVTHYFRTRGGWYNQYQYWGVWDSSAAHAAGVEGSAWQMSQNIRLAGGESVWYIGDEYDDDYWFVDSSKTEASLGYNQDLAFVDKSKLAATKHVDLRQVQELDVIGMYYQDSNYLNVAAIGDVSELQEGLAEGDAQQLFANRGGMGRMYTHALIVTRTPVESYSVEKIQDVGSFVQRTLGITETYLGFDPVYVNGRKTVFNEADGQYYYAGAGDQPEGSPIVLTSGDTVDIQETTVAHEYNGRAREEPLTRFLSTNGRFTIHEIMRPNQDVVAAMPTDVDFVQMDSENDLENALGDIGVSEADMSAAVQAVVSQNTLPQGSVSTEGDIVIVPRKTVVTNTGDIAANLQALPTVVGDQSSFVEEVQSSAKERATEYGVPEQDVDDLSEAMLIFEMRESRGGSALTPMGAPKLWVEQQLEQIGVFGEDKTYGVLQIRPDRAARVASDLGVDFEGVDALASDDEVARRAGQRAIAQAWVDFTDDSMSFDQRLGIVAAEYNIGRGASVNAGLQTHLADMGYGIEEQSDGRLGEGTLDLVEQFYNEQGLEFDRQQAEQDCYKMGADYSSCSEGYMKGVAETVLTVWQKHTGETGSLVEVPQYYQGSQDQPYIRNTYAVCADITTTPGRCAFANT